MSEGARYGDLSEVQEYDEETADSSANRQDASDDQQKYRKSYGRRNGRNEDMEVRENLMDSLDSLDSVAIMRTRPGPLMRLYLRFRRFWIRNRPDNWSGESDPQTVWMHLVNILTLLFVAICVLTVPILLNIVSPRAPIVPGSSAGPGQAANLASGTEAAVAATDANCSAIGLRMMTEKGGTAADAVIAAALCQTVVNPHSSGLGGGGISLYYNAKLQKSFTYDGLVTVPAQAPKKGANYTDPGSRVGVPGTVRMLEALHKDYGKLAWKELVADAASLAKSWTVSEYFAAVLEDNKDDILSSQSLKIFFAKETVLADIAGPDTDAPAMEPLDVLREGDNVEQSELAKTLEQIADNGPAYYYEKLSASIAKESRDFGGFLLSNDLREYSQKKRDAITFYVDGYKVHIAPPPSTGVLVGKTLNILEGFRLRRLGRNGFAYHIFIEAAKMAFNDWNEVDDPDFDDSINRVVQRLLDKDHAQSARTHIDTTKPKEQLENSSVRSDEPLKLSGGTHVAAIDKDGNVASMAMTLGSPFGSKIMCNSTGLIMNDELEVSAKRSSKLAPGKRPVSGLIPVVVEDFAQMQYALGTSGEIEAVYALTETLLNAVEYGDDIAGAIAAPRLYYKPETNTVSMEAINVEQCATTNAFQRTNGAPFGYWDEVCLSLKERGHSVVESKLIGGIQGLAIRNVEGEDRQIEKTFFAFSDPRSAGSAAAAE
eukprot:Plantae.Rhodophyta-Purpureofilum_apyrenoidigerum.ctg743.p1 GENE.Plantae.Rhodophyta-Purpureofilum_apyrenoidigerum.ctg743~~Plantae.Rhodophyta-Purpureofilum_apyrenoidigerum.ctg743.p1  ORF type:complete len:713 (+),score=144.28 Plantae.Rhodophyta-Purpureofilum_apyrenoidigerum.ctg743:150-2288(+)